MDSDKPTQLHIRLLGGFQVERNGSPIPPSAWLYRVAAKTMVKLLAMQPGHRFHREEMMELLWPDTDVTSSLGRFRKAVHAARNALEPDRSRSSSSFIELRDDVLSLDVEQVRIDIDEFEELGERALAFGDLASLETALAIYRGELLPEDRYEDWAMARREALRSLYVRLLQGMAVALERNGAFERAISTWQQIVDLDPLQEEGHRALMQLYASTGNRAQAMRQYQLCCDALMRELGAEPESETEDLYSKILEGEVAREPRSEIAVRTPSPLPPALRHEPDVPIVGRDRVFDVLRERLAAAMAGTGGVTLIGGEAGVGKSRLAGDFARVAARQGALVLWGTSYGSEHYVPYGSFIEALDGYLRGQSQAERNRFAEQYPLVAQIIPSLAPTGVALETPLTSEVAHGRLFAALAAFLTELGANRPLVLVLDDLHAADAASLQLVQYLARYAEDNRWLVLGTYRDEELIYGSDAHRILAGAMRQGLIRRIELHRLSPDDTARFIQSLLPSGIVDKALAHRIYALSLGNPFFARELVQAMRQEEALVMEGGQWVAPSVAMTRVPRQVHDLVATRIGQLDEGTVRVLGLASIAGMEWRFEDVNQASQIALPHLSMEVVLDALETALDAQIIEDRGEVYAFRHPLFQAVLREQLARPRRMQFHGALAEAIERRAPEDVDTLAYHYARSSHHEKAISYLERAARRAVGLRAYAEAATYYHDLVDRLARARREREAAVAREQLSEALIVTARYADALTELEQAAATYNAQGDIAGLAWVTAHIGRIHFLRGQPAQGLARLVPAVERLEAEELSPRVHAMLLASLASLYWSSGCYTEQMEVVERALEVVRSSDDPETEAVAIDAELWRAVGLLAQERVDEVVDLLESVAPRAEAGGNLLHVSRAWDTLATAFQLRGEYAAQLPYIERALDAALRLGDPTRIAFMLSRRGWYHWTVGRWDEARQDLERAVATDLEVGPTWATPHALYSLASIRFAQGDWDAAARDLRQCVDITQARGNVRGWWTAEALLAEMEIRQGQTSEALARLEMLYGTAALDRASRTRLLVLRLEAQLASREFGEGWALAQQALEDLPSAGGGPEVVDALRLAAIMASHEGQTYLSRNLVDRALALARQIESPYLEAQVGSARGDIARIEGDRATAVEAYSDALAIFRRLGARSDADEVARQLRPIERAARRSRAG